MDNRIKTTLLLTALTIFIMIAGQILGGRSGMIMALVLAAGMNFFSYWYSDRIVLRMYGAAEVSDRTHPDLIRIVRDLARSAALPMPRVYVIPSDAPNAFATGRNPEHAAVAVTEGLLYLLERDEIAGVLAHELAHVKNRDILISSIAATMAGAIMMLANMARWAAFFGAGSREDDEGGGGFLGMILMSIIAPVAAMLIQMAISRSREYLADDTGASIVGSGLGLARALEKIGRYSGHISMDARPETAHMFIANPLSGSRLRHLFSTHPPMRERIARLRGASRSSGDMDPGPDSSSSGVSGARNFWDRMR